MISNLRKSVEESLELELRALLKEEYFDKLSFEERVDIMMSIFKCFEQYVSK